MLLIPVLVISLCMQSCRVGQSMTASAQAPALNKQLIIEASSQQAATEARCIVYQFYQPRHMDFTEQQEGCIQLRFTFLTHYPQRYRQMIDQLKFVPGITILQQQ